MPKIDSAATLDKPIDAPIQHQVPNGAVAAAQALHILPKYFHVHAAPTPSAPPQLPPLLEFNFSPIKFPEGFAIGGSSNLTLHQDGSFTFSGQFHDSGLLSYKTALVWAIKDSSNNVYTFAHSGETGGTTNLSTSRDDTWGNAGQNDAIASNWAGICAANDGSGMAKVNVDIGELISEITAAIGAISKVVSIVAA